MPKAIFEFTQHRNSYSVFVKNLESLTVTQIQEIELFVKQRKGIFNFQNYTFSIQKRVEFFEFYSLIQHLELDVVCIENIIEQVQSQRISFGQYKGMSYAELPDTYLIWLKNNYRGTDQENVLKEVEKRNL
ncbi:MAG: hypothetical protein FP820_12310 [Sulfurimonas sp.]|jgi:hypothetical protein|nr:hypothetical protein [Sulfurimonas sp.]MBU1216194.1 DUF3820 family protein [bacterium]MBU1434500.1 DUF3820 family protein [bacterium]MBU1502078.1 DUF3820 family protein [bacterium]MBU3937912.1 DUF3820 family protein [bacterium]